MASLRSFAQAPAQIDKMHLLISNIPENINIQQLEEINWSMEHRGKLLIEFKNEYDVTKVLHEFSENNFKVSFVTIFYLNVVEK